jgi:hypothetical protein
MDLPVERRSSRLKGCFFEKDLFFSEKSAGRLLNRRPAWKDTGYPRPQKGVRRHFNSTFVVSCE